MKSIFSHLLIAVVVSIVSFVLFRAYYPPAVYFQLGDERTSRLVSHSNPYLRGVNTAPGSGPVLLEDFRDVSRRVTPTVVNIVSRGATGYRMSGGSGVIISADGYIITNNHVIQDASRLEVTLNTRRRFDAKVIGRDSQTDLALIKIDATGLLPMRYGNSDRVEVGEWVLAVGNPFNLASTVTAGIVSAKARNINILSGSYAVESFIQTDATVNPGNSGGALVNTQGDLIGINTAIISESGISEGYSFAIPVNLVRKVITDLMQYGEVQRAILGVQIDEVTDEIAAEKKLPRVAGVLIRQVTAGGGASESGLQAGDVIISINGKATGSVPELQEQMARYNPGDRVSLEYYRNGRLFRNNSVQLKRLNDRMSNRQ